jgi:3-hydroxyisobutyrate dehydrogenase-like beta-hydroxyacid dehydrogenase
MDQKPAVGVIGLGHIGAGVSRSISSGGFTVSGYDVRMDAVRDLAGVVTPASAPAEIAAQSDVVLIAVLNDEQVRSVLVGTGGLLDKPARCKTVVSLSTTTLSTVRWAATECEQLDVALLDCGVSGGRGGLEARAIAAMVGGPAQAFGHARPVLEAFADPVLHMGELGRGMAAKLARNVLVYTDWSVAWEAARLAEAAGVDVAKFVQAVDASDRYIDGHTALIRAGVGLAQAGPEARARGAAVAIYAEKDLRAALELGEELEIEMPAARSALTRLEQFTNGAPQATGRSQRAR